ncbi:hypothetical protein CVT25_002745 [Psilocybe cyanescens]|uniref:CFEM domain-containing protein n=1 Tax=Psilocybe cyanescens TaxID=93625 RepID=A0A409XU83_PSICY|nr:hypothetical protein CVT25_002745 [Psilocybe cyanescens]
MRFSTIAIALFGAAASASATTIGSGLFARQGLPDCASSCTGSADFDGCAISDTHCLCTSKKFVDSTTACVMAACTGSDLQNALKASQDLCAAVGVTLTSSSASSSTSAASSSTSSSSSSATPTSPSNSAPSNSAPSNNPSSAASPLHGANTFGLLAAGLVALAL